MKKMIPAFLLTATMPLLSMAQVAPTHVPPVLPKGLPHEMGPQHCGKFGGKEINNFTPEQHKKMSEIMQAQEKQRRDITKKYLEKLSETDKKAMYDELQQSREATGAAIRAIMTPEQQKRFDEQKAKQEERMKEWKEFQEWKASKANNTSK